MKILVIGGTGIIGGSIGKVAINQGDEVISISRSGAEKRRKDGLPKECDVQLNWQDELQAQQYLADKHFDVIVDCVVFNVEQLKHSLQIIKGHCDQYVFISSVSVNEHKLNAKETDVDKETQWAYAVNKLKCEEWLQAQETSLAWTIIRPGVIYDETRIPYSVVGRANHWTLVSRILQEKPILGCQDNNTRHPVMHADDFGAMAYGALGNAKAHKQVFNVASECGIMWDDVIKAIEKAIDKKALIVHIPTEIYKNNYELLYPEIKYDKVKPLTLDCSKIKAISTLKAEKEEMSIDIGIKNTIDFLQNNYATKPEDRFYDLCSDLILTEYCKKYQLQKEDATIAASYADKIGFSGWAKAKVYILLRKIKNNIRKK